MLAGVLGGPQSGGGDTQGRRDCDPTALPVAGDLITSLWSAWLQIEKKYRSASTTKGWSVVHGGKPACAGSASHAVLFPRLSDGTLALPPPDRLVRILHSRAIWRGSDVRFSTGELYRPYSSTRAGIEASLWTWKAIASYSWRSGTDAHINQLEVTAVLDQLKRKSLDEKAHSTRFLMLIDSQVALAVLSKGRSASARINLYLKRVGALCVAADLYPFYSWVASSKNPADGPSRWRRCAKRLRAAATPKES